MNERINDPYLREGERVIVHPGGRSSPICVMAEVSWRSAFQSLGGLPTKPVGLFYAIEHEESVDLRFQTATEIQVKMHGESNGILSSGTFRGWWAHVLEVEGFGLALLGRPNFKRVPLSYTPLFPHLQSARLWRMGLQKLPECLGEYAPLERERRAPRLAAAFDPLRSPMDDTTSRLKWR